MPKEIYNEGRVVGLSAYEIYVKQYLINDGDIDEIASEREWLAAGLAMGDSMLLKLPKIVMNPGHEDEYAIIDITFPYYYDDDGKLVYSRLAAANTIVASFFDGDCDEWEIGQTNLLFDTSRYPTYPSCRLEDIGYWSTSISSYGDLISEHIDGSPAGTIPYNTYPDAWSDERKTQLRGYMNVLDGVVIQPGTWKDGGSMHDEDNLKFSPKLSDGTRSLPTLRLAIHGSLTNPPIILLTGFTLQSILVGTRKEVSDTPADGDFIGPAVFPWANKVVFSVPTTYLEYFVHDRYVRKVYVNDPTTGRPDPEKGDTDFITNTDSSTIDMRSGSLDRRTPYPVLENYYGKNYTPYDTGEDAPRFSPNWAVNDATNKSKSRIPNMVESFVTTGDGTAVLTVYQKSSIYPPALYGTAITVSGQNNPLNPIDVVAPGTVKMFYADDGTTMKDYQNTFPGTTAMNKNPDGSIETLNNDGNKVPVASVGVVDVDSENGLGAKTTTGGKQITAVSLVDKTGNSLPTTGNSDLDPDFSKISWRQFLNMLKDNKYIDFRNLLYDYLVGDDGISIAKKSDGKLYISTTNIDSKINTLVVNEDIINWKHSALTQSQAATDPDYKIDPNSRWRSSSAYTIYPYNRIASYIRPLSNSQTEKIPLAAQFGMDIGKLDNPFYGNYITTGRAVKDNYSSDGNSYPSFITNWSGCRIVVNISVGFDSPVSEFKTVSWYNTPVPNKVYIRITTNVPRQQWDGTQIITPGYGSTEYVTLGADRLSNDLFQFKQTSAFSSDTGKLSKLFSVKFTGPLAFLNALDGDNKWRYNFSNESGTGSWSIRYPNERNISQFPYTSNVYQPGQAGEFMDNGVIKNVNLSFPYTCGLTSLSPNENLGTYTDADGNSYVDTNSNNARIICYAASANDGYAGRTVGAGRSLSLDIDRLYAFTMNTNLYGVFQLV